ncbi:hypothetical protein [Allosphingosinicella vermicomposti]|uniref:hypothetical protein n=1 Tax=Allosphingosinicella vermicomposti TaxID=614671 RepID=UPI000D0EF287|nr:hypothetical protein [Allosphingosinicella vermicomposti]
MTALVLTAMLFATAPQAATSVGAPDLKSMTCAQLKTEGDRHLAIMMHGPDPEGTKLAEEKLNRDMTNLGRSQGAQGALLGVAQAVGGVLVGAGAAIGVDAANKAATAANMGQRAEIMARADSLHNSNQKAQNTSGDLFMTISAEYRRRGCESPTNIQVTPPKIDGSGTGVSVESMKARALDELSEDLMKEFEEDSKKKQGVYNGQPD